ncbi:MAG: hypothetical protein C0392_12935 [Syntrophus sp. (in: bacteria)]|nr:hypothetical protein [Syntrophus sp. (in: bacteria)]
MKIIFFSDTHLCKDFTERTHAVETFIKNVCAGADMVFLVGDIFEFYHGYKGYIYPWYQGIADALRGVTKRGKSVYYIEGNHEFGMGRYFQSYTGAVCVNEVAMDIEGKRVFVSHGDKFVGGPVRAMLKSRLAAWVMDCLGPRFTWAVAMAARVVLSKKEKPYNKRAFDRFRDYAGRKFDEGYDVVILAHSHMPDKVETEPGGKQRIYLNTGDFIANATYITYESCAGFQIVKYLPFP